MLAVQPRSVSTASLVSMLWLAPFFVECSDDGSSCVPGVPCHCANARGCIYECLESNCNPQCNDVSFCDVHCGALCNTTCNNVHDCSIECGSNCDVECHDVDRCVVRVGPGSQPGASRVSCRNLGSCEVACRGACEVDCTSVGSCSVTCADGAPTHCGGERFVCAQPC